MYSPTLSITNSLVPSHIAYPYKEILAYLCKKGFLYIQRYFPFTLLTLNTIIGLQFYNV